MNERIKKLTELTLSGRMYVSPTKTEYNDADTLLPRNKWNQNVFANIF